MYKRFLMLAFSGLMLLCGSNSMAQVAESFEGAVFPTGWAVYRVSGTVGAPNIMYQITAPGTYATVATAFNGSKMIRYSARNVAYPTNNANNTQAGDAIILTTPALDWSGRDTATVNTTRPITFRFWRDVDATGGVNTVQDYIRVYINDKPDTTGATLLTETTTSATQIPRSATQAPVHGGGWQLLSYNLPALVAGPGGSKFDTTSTAYAIILFKGNPSGVGGNNMYVDSVYAPEWKMSMVATHAELIYNNNSTTGPGVTNNVILGMKIVTKGSLSAIKLDSIKFLPAGCTNFLADVSAARCYYTHDTSYWYTNGTQIPHDPGSPLGELGFGYWVTPCSYATPAAFTLRPGTENYVWLVYDIAAGATAGNFVDADFDGFWAGSNCTNKISSIPTSIAGAMEIDISYAIPTYTVGTSWAGYTNNDYVSAVDLQGDYGTALDNWYHYISVGPPCPASCDRFSPHPPDYTIFQAQNNGVNRNRLLKLTAGKGVRTGSAAYTLKIQCGTWYSSNYVSAYFDFNKDGDFQDRYNGVGGFINEWCNKNGAVGDNISGVYPGVAWGLLQANINSPFSGTYASYAIHVPTTTDAVTNTGGTGGPLKIANIRMRVREVYATSAFTPFTSHTYGETEDYTVQILDNCPPLGANVCKWLGTNSNWDDPINWCPLIPTLSDMAVIPVMSGLAKYPTIDSGTVAVCRTLKIENGAQVNIDCQYSTGLANDTKGSLRVADSLIIGYGTITSTASLNVKSSYSNTYHIPSISVPPPGGTGLIPNSFFQATANLKIQVAYTASELYTTFGWRVGDVIDSIRFNFKTTTGTLVTFQNCRLVKFETSSPVTWSNPSPPNTSIAVKSGYLGVTSGPTVVYGGIGDTIKMNLTSNGFTYYTLSLNPGTFVWNGGNVILSWEYFSLSALGKGNYVMYDEGSAAYNVLTLKCNSPAGSSSHTNSGYALDGYQHSSGGNNPNIISTGGVQANCASNYRPRLEFFLRRPYNTFPITIGKAWVNNNNTGSPVGTNGFTAGKSKVTFDPTIRSGVNSPGLASGVNTWNPTLQSATLSTTADTLSITSGRYALGGTGYATGTSSTTFNILEIKANAAGTGGSIVKQRFNTYTDTLSMTSGEMALNEKILTIKNGEASALISGGGWIKSEDNATGNIASILRWKIASIGTYSVPFGKKIAGVGTVFPLNIYPFAAPPAASAIGDVDLATYGTATSANTPFPLSPAKVLTMNDTTPAANDATPWTVDRFWYIKKSGTGDIQDSIAFNYPEIEGTVDAFYKGGAMKAQRYSKSLFTNNWGWNHYSFFNPQRDWSNGIISGVKAVSGTGSGSIPGPNLGSVTDTGYIWTIIQWGLGQAPLPVELISFNAKKVDEKVKVWWNVQSENGVSKYIVQRTTDYSFMDEIAQKAPVGPSNSPIYYEAWDNAPLSGMQYYRLRTLSIDGSEQYSQFVPVNFNKDGLFQITQVSANSDASLLSVRFELDGGGPYAYFVSDLAGKVLIQGNAFANNGSNQLDLPASISKGIYLVTIQNTNQLVSKKFVY